MAEAYAAGKNFKKQLKKYGELLKEGQSEIKETVLTQSTMITVKKDSYMRSATDLIQRAYIQKCFSGPCFE